MLKGEENNCYRKVEFLLCFVAYCTNSGTSVSATVCHPVHAARAVIKLDGVGPFDNRPSTNKLHHFVLKKREKKVACDM